MSDSRESSTSFFQTIKERCDLEEYLTKQLNVELVSSGSGMMSALCPFHEEDTPSFVMNNEEGGRPWKTWHCFGACDKGGTILDAVMEHESTVTDVFEAAAFLNELYDLGLEANSEAYKAFKKTVEETRAHTEAARAEMGSTDSRVAKQAKAYLHNRGYTDETIEYFELGVDTEQSKAGRLSIPIYDKMGQPVSAANRALFDKFPCRACKTEVSAEEMRKRRFQADKAKNKGEVPAFGEWNSCPRCGASAKDAQLGWLTSQTPKYLFIKDFDKARYLYNEHGARGPLIKNPEGTTLGLFLVEGYPDAWAGHQSGHRAICAYSGAVLSDEQAKEAIDLAKKAEKPVILVPDFDETGQGRLGAGSGVPGNIRKLNSVDPTVEVQVVYGIDKLTHPVGSGAELVDKGCKDLGEVLQYLGAEKVSEVLCNNRWAASEWQIRQVIETTNPKTGEPFFSKYREMELISEILRNIQTRESVDHLIPMLAAHWNIREEQVRNFFYANLSAAEQVSARHLFKDILQAQEESAEFLADSHVIPLGFAELDRCLPGGGVRPGQLMMMLGKSGTGKTMLASQFLGNMADRDTRCLFFTLEQGAGSFYPRLACQALDMPAGEVEELIKDASPALQKVSDLYQHMVLVDNVPTETSEAVLMTPGKIQSIIQEANLTHFEGRPVEVVIIDHLGILDIGEGAPRGTRESESAAPGWIMKELFKVCKATRVFMLVLQQLPKQVPPGVPFSFDAGWGGSAQTNFCDYIIQIWRPEQAEDLADEDRSQVEGQYKIALGKNRYGPSALGHYFFDKTTLRILPPLRVAQPRADELGGDEDELMFLAPGEGGEDVTGPPPFSDAGLTAAGLAALDAATPAAVPRDTNALLAALGAVEDTDGDVHEDDPFGSSDEEGLFNID